MKSPLIRLNAVKPSHIDGSGSTKPPITPSTPAMKEGIVCKKSLSELRVLVVDDNADNAELLQLYVRKSVKSADTAESAQDALSKISEAARNGKYDLVLCDITLDNGKNGLDVEKEAKEVSPGTAFVFTTGYKAEDFSKRFLGCKYPARVLVKPIKKDQLLEFLGTIFDAQDS